MTVFADTSYYLALHNERDEHHGAAVWHARRSRFRVATTDFVLLELGNAWTSGAMRRAYVQVCERLRGDPHTLVVPASRSSLLAGQEVFRHGADKGWSIVDCTSFAVMRRLRLEAALTDDRHFQQAGFRALLREGPYG